MKENKLFGKTPSYTWKIQALHGNAELFYPSDVILVNTKVVNAAISGTLRRSPIICIMFTNVQSRLQSSRRPARKRFGARCLSPSYLHTAVTLCFQQARGNLNK
jgi:hypothetical protein